MLTSLSGLMASLRTPHVRSAATRLASELLPRQLGREDQVIGLVWATVDLGRTIGETEAPFVPTGRDRLLGGRAARLRYGSLDLFVEEPDAEGRLAANLARFGEGVAACYVERSGPSHRGAVDDKRPGVALTPLGRPGRLRPHEHPWGPFLIAVERS